MADLPLVEVDVPLGPQPVEELLIVLGIEEDDAFPFGNGLDHVLPLLSPRPESWEELRVTVGSLIPQFCCEIMPSVQ